MDFSLWWQGPALPLWVPSLARVLVKVKDTHGRGPGDGHTNVFERTGSLQSPLFPVLPAADAVRTLSSLLLLPTHSPSILCLGADSGMHQWLLCLTVGPMRDAGWRWGEGRRKVGALSHLFPPCCGMALPWLCFSEASLLLSSAVPSPRPFRPAGGYRLPVLLPPGCLTIPSYFLFFFFGSTAWHVGS